MRGSRAFAGYVDVCDTGHPLVNEVTYDTPFGDGYMLGTFAHRVARLGDGVIVFLHDVTQERRMEAELKAYADVVAHDLSEPLSGIAMLVTLLEQHPEEPPAAMVVPELLATTGRARELIEGDLAYARSENARGPCRFGTSWTRSPTTCVRSSKTRTRPSSSASCLRSRATLDSSVACSRTSSATP